MPSGNQTLAAHRQTVDVAVIGDGVIGLSTALELARAGIDSVVLGVHREGLASTAAAGLLAPTIGVPVPPIVRRFALASFDRYPAFVESLREFDPGLSLINGILKVPSAPSPPSDDASTEQITRDQLFEMEPALSAPLGAVLHRSGSAIDNVRLFRALRRAVGANARIRLLADSPAASIEGGGQQAVARAGDNVEIEAGYVVIAAGAWSPAIGGLPRQLPIVPMKGQMLALGSTPVKHAVMGDEAYLVPRESETVVGSTLEDAGFDTTTTSEAIDRLRDAAVRLCPALDSAALLRAWAGLRPATPDMLPIIGPDPDASRVLYACGHSKNGILLAPITAQAVAALVRNEQPDVDLTPFSVSRFD